MPSCHIWAQTITSKVLISCYITLWGLFMQLPQFTHPLALSIASSVHRAFLKKFLSTSCVTRYHSQNSVDQSESSSFEACNKWACWCFSYSVIFPLYPFPIHIVTSSSLLSPWPSNVPFSLSFPFLSHPVLGPWSF